MAGILREEKEEPRRSNEFDRKQVLKNTELNAQLGLEGQRIREQLRSHQKQSESPSSDESEEPEERPKRKFPKTKAPTASSASKRTSPGNGFTNVGFDEDEIQDWDVHRGQSQKIVEPNTPYMGTAADTEYYDEDPVPEDLDLGGSAA